MSTPLPRHGLERVERNGRRHYLTPVGVVPSVTTVLDATRPARDIAGLERWRRQIGAAEADRIRDDAAARGEKLHLEIEDYLREGKKPSYETGWWKSVWPVLNRITNVRLVEGRVWHPQGFAGTVDLIATLDGAERVIDWKTKTKPQRPEWMTEAMVQGAGYAAAANRVYEGHGLRIAHLGAIVVLEAQPAQEFLADAAETMSYWRNFLGRLGQYKKAN